MIQTQPRKRPAQVVQVFVLALIAFLLPTVSPTAAVAQTPGSIELVAQRSWVDDGGIFNIQVRVAGASPESAVVLRVYSPWLERDDFLRQDLGGDREVLLELDPVILGDTQNLTNEVIGLELLIDGPLTRLQETVIRTESVPVESAEGGSGVEPVATPEPEPAEEQIPVLTSDGGSAVYPIEVLLIDVDGEVTDSFLTTLIELPRRDLRSPLNVSIVLEAEAPSLTTTNIPEDFDPETLADLATLSTTFAQHPNANMALSISPETLLALSRDDSEDARSILEQLRASLTSAQILPNPLTEVQEQAWFDADFTERLVELYEAGSDATIETLGIEPDPSIILLDPTINGAGVGQIEQLGSRGAIIRADQLTRLNRVTFPEALTTSFLVESNDPIIDPIPALVTDNDLAAHFTNPGRSVGNANRLLADLVLLSLQNDGGREGVVVNPPVDWKPDASFLNVLLSGLERIPIIQGATPLQTLAETEITPRLGIGTVSGPLIRQLNPSIQAESLRSFRTEFSQASNAIDSWSTVIVDDSDSRQRLDQLLHLSTDHRLDDGQQEQFIEAIYSLIDLQRETAVTTPASETITLTGREAVVPIVLENNLNTNATVLLRLSSEELDFPEGVEIIDSLTPGPNRVEIPITARASGDSPIRIQVLSPDGLILLGTTEVLVRTVAFSGVGIAIGAIAIIVLLVWWLRHDRDGDDTVVQLPREDNEPSGAIEEVIGV